MELFNLVGTAYAQGAPAPKGPGMFDMLIMPAVFLLIMYLFMIRPQQRKAREHANLLTTLKAGDEVVTSGGIIGKVRSVADTFVSIEVGGNATIKVLKNHISALSKSLEPAAAKK